MQNKKKKTKLSRRGFLGGMIGAAGALAAGAKAEGIEHKKKPKLGRPHKDDLADTYDFVDRVVDDFVQNNCELKGCTYAGLLDKDKKEVSWPTYKRQRIEWGLPTAKVSWPTYKRQRIEGGLPTAKVELFPSPRSEMFITNTNRIEFPEMSVCYTANVKYLGIFNAEKDGNLIYCCMLSMCFIYVDGISLEAGDRVLVSPGDLKVTMG